MSPSIKSVPPRGSRWVNRPRELPMTKNLVFLILLLFVSVPAFAQKSPLNDMVDTEYAFAKAAKDTTIRESFMEFIADDGVLFRPGAVNGKKWMTEHPVPPSEKRPLLAWQPAYAGMAKAGDMGFTTGPW